MEKKILKHHIPKEKEGRYYQLKLTVPPGMETMTIRYQYDKGSGNCVDLGLSDQDGNFLGWSGSARQEITIGPWEATPGYRAQALKAGSWGILVGAYHIPLEGLDVRYEVTFRKPHPRWLKGDLHMHSTASDGSYDTYTLARRAKKEGLDFIAIADHNNYCENDHLPKLPGLTMVPAVEWTHYKGHINFFGVKAPFENAFIANTEEEMKALLKQVTARGALISLNHPKDALCPYLWQADTGYHMIELWNGPMRPANLKAARWWHEMLTQGRRIPIVGGSDFHKDKSPVRFAHPTTYVFADSPAPEDICGAIAKGRSYITASPRGVQLGITGDGLCFGDILPAKAGRTWTFTAKGGQPGMVLRLMTQAGIAAEVPFHLTGTAHLEVTEKNWSFAYLTAGYPMKEDLFIRAISNPVYFDSAEV